ncbi:MAG: A/G-specific adenine glycosylase [Chitinophagaceae bacterium]
MYSPSEKKPGTGFSKKLLKWNREKNDRQMPWKGEKDPYKIWLSEIILQQTRVDQGLNYYKNFIAAFPDIHQLANAEDNKVFKLWEGLGYYTRCRNLLLTARHISKTRNGKFPRTYQEIIQLKGVGAYTAAAISSFAFNLPYAVVDGNVFRVISRVFGISTPADTTEGKKEFTQLADELLDKKEPGTYNQAIMDFGATVCKPLLPLCTQCVFKKDCVAFNQNRIDELPVKQKKITIKKRWFNYLVLEYNNQLLIHERLKKDIWQHLYEFVIVETNKAINPEMLINSTIDQKLIKVKAYKIAGKPVKVKQLLSHQLINGLFVHITIKSKPAFKENYFLVSKENLKQYPFPKLINDYIKQGLEEKK